MPSIFSKIVAGEIPSYKIAENEFCFAFLDIFPLQLGHTLVVSKKETDKLFLLDDVYYLELMKFSKKIAVAIQVVVPCNRVSMHVVGLEVPHAHIHLIPINKTSDCNFANQKLKFTKEEFETIALKIAVKLAI